MTPNHHTRAGHSLIAFGVSALAVMLLAGFWLGEAPLDPGMLLLIGLGVGVRAGNRFAAKWAVGVSLLYLIAITAGVAAVVAGWFTPPGRLAPVADHPAALLTFAGVAVAWLVINLILLRRALRASAPHDIEPKDSAWPAPKTI